MSVLSRMRSSPKWPSRWPIRWKLAAVSSGLTFVILVVFGLAVGQFTTQQLEENYEAETRAEATDLTRDVQQRVNLTPGYLLLSELSDVFSEASGPAALTLLANQTTYSSNDAPDLGPVTGEGMRIIGDFQIATVPLEPLPGQVASPGYLQYGRNVDRLRQSTGRVWISILAGTLGATLLAALAGVVLSRRAMRPVSSLTSAAREIARTRDPSVTLNHPVADDEVAELTRTLNGMLRELSLARAEREKSLTRQREFIADASHELRTPLTSVLANLELLDHSLEKSRDRELEQESVDSALRSSRRMRRLVADLQILARADAGRERLHEICDLSQIAANAVKEIRPLSDEHTIELVADGPDPVSGNPDDLHRMVVNLVGNAVRHTPDGSVISVEVERASDSSKASISVGDDGPGIPEEIRPQVFDRFVRSSGPGDRASTGGTGLGLAIVKAIAAEHGGTATVGDSEAGGALFTIDLPLAHEVHKETVSAPLGRV